VELLSFVFGVNFMNYKMALLIITTGAIASALVAIFINMLTIMRKLTIQVFVLFISNFILVLAYVIFLGRVDIVGGVTLFAMTNVVQAVVFAAIYINETRKLRYEKA
jgi:O-antigen/teichoic acid export membrane protein